MSLNTNTKVNEQTLYETCIALRAKYGDYIRMPRAILPNRDTSEHQIDTFGIDARYQIVEEYFKEHGPQKSLIDIGGNCGYVTLSLLEQGLIEEAIIYDVDVPALNFGRDVAEYMGISDKCKFVEQSISIETLKDIPNADVIICQYLIHHAGALFDQDTVAQKGWDQYAIDFMSALRDKYKLGIFAMAFKGTKPANWKVAECQRPQRFLDILSLTNWKCVLSRNVYELLTNEKSYMNLSSHKANPFKNRLLSLAWKIGGLRAEHKVRSLLFNREISKLERYFFYIAE